MPTDPAYEHWEIEHFARQQLPADATEQEVADVMLKTMVGLARLGAKLSPESRSWLIGEINERTGKPVQNLVEVPFMGIVNAYLGGQ